VTFTVLFAVWNALKGRKAASALWCAASLCIHPLMAVFGISYTLILWCTTRRRFFSKNTSEALLVAGFPFIDLLPSPSYACQEPVGTRPYFFLLQWLWYEWLGVLAPLLLLWFMARLAKDRHQYKIWRISRALIIYGLIYLIVALLVTIPARFQAAARFQPM